MSLSQPHPVEYLLTPPPSPRNFYFPSKSLSRLDTFLDGPDIEDVPYGQNSSAEPLLLDEDHSSPSLSPHIGDLPRFSERLDALSTNPFRRRPSLRTHNTGSRSKSSNSLRSPDRFLPKPSHLDTPSQRYHANKELNKLSAMEKLLRCEIADIDAFSPRRRATSPNSLTASLTAEQLPNNLHVGGPTAITFHPDSNSINGERGVSLGSAWTVGGLAPLSIGVLNGRGGLIGSGTNAPLYTTSFSSTAPNAEHDRDKHEGRLAKALNIDRVQRVLEFFDSMPPGRIFIGKHKYAEISSKTVWSGTEWVREGRHAILDAPNLRDDFYCSILAYSPTCHTLAVGLGSMLYAWSETQGVHILNAGCANGSWLTSIAFSSTQGCKCILAFGRSDGILTLMSLYDRPLPRFEVQQPCPIACVSWRPTVSLRKSRNHLTPGLLVKIEDLVVGDEIGNVYYYSVEWPEAWEVDRNGWSGVLTLLARISIHSQQICGLAWSNDGTIFATGGNDNLCCLFEASRILQSQSDDPDTEEQSFTSGDGIPRVQSADSRDHVKAIFTGAEKHRWIHGAAVKAIAFCPWRDSLVATGGGSNDKCIHFFHTISGACLATISVAAQVTSLIWSTTRREIVATFGYAQPEHPYRIAVFSWPECKQVAAIPWEGEHRALYAIPYPGGPDESHSSHEGARTMSRTAEEGCIVVAASDESVKFHEVWSAGRKATVGREGLLGGSDILEGLEGIDKEGELIR